VQPKLFLLGDTRVQPFLLTGLGLLTDVGGGSSGTLGLFRPGLGIDVHVDEQVALAVTGYYEFYFNSRNVGFPEAGFVSVLVRFDL